MLFPEKKLFFLYYIIYVQMIVGELDKYCRIWKKHSMFIHSLIRIIFYTFFCLYWTQDSYWEKSGGVGIYFFKFHKRILEGGWENEEIVIFYTEISNWKMVLQSIFRGSVIKKCDKKVQHPFLKSIFQYRFILIFFSTQ